MGTPELKHPGYTIADWQTWEGAWELIGGEAYPTYGQAPAPTLDHQRVSGALFLALSLALKEAKERTGGSGPCEVFHAPVDVFLGSDVVQPDLVICCDESQKTERGIVGPPALVVEVLSPSTASRDWFTKRGLYERAGVPEYLVIDPVEQIGFLLRLEDGRYADGQRIPFGSLVALLGGKLPVTL